jgi:hypothetical protein
VRALQAAIDEIKRLRPDVVRRLTDARHRV